MEMGKGTSRGIQRTKGKDHKSIYTHSFKERRKFWVETDISGHAIGGGVLFQE